MFRHSSHPSLRMCFHLEPSRCSRRTRRSTCMQGGGSESSMLQHRFRAKQNLSRYWRQAGRPSPGFRPGVRVPAPGLASRSESRRQAVHPSPGVRPGIRATRFSSAAGAGAEVTSAAAGERGTRNGGGGSASGGGCCFRRFGRLLQSRSGGSSIVRCNLRREHTSSLIRV